MNKRIISIFIAAAMSISIVIGVSAAENGVDAVNAEVYTNMSVAEKTEYINENLSVRLQHLSRLVSITSNQALDKMADEVENALNDGLTVVDIKEAIYHSGAYCGFTRAAAALDAADAALKNLGQDITYESRITSTEETRYAAGLTKDNILAVPLLTAPYNGFPRTLNMRNALAAAIEAAETAKTTITMQIGNPVMTINETQQNIDSEGTAPIVIDNRTLLPVRAFVEGIGGSVDWNENTQTAALHYNGIEIRITINSTAAYINNEVKTLDVTPAIINGRTMLPIRFIAENLGYTVQWSQDTQTVTISNIDE